MVVNTIFSDLVVNASELRKNQKRLLEKAFDNPITIRYGKKQLAIVNRELLRRIYLENHYLQKILKTCEDYSKGLKSDVFPWIESLSIKEKEEFHAGLLSSALRAVVTGNWTELEDFITDWQATAEAEANPELLKALKDEKPSTYVTIK